MLAEMPLLSNSERYENAALRLENGSCQPKPRVGRRIDPPKFRIALPRWAKEGSAVVSTVKGIGVAV
jgi:hypothetical protein